MGLALIIATAFHAGQSWERGTAEFQNVEEFCEEYELFCDENGEIYRSREELIEDYQNIEEMSDEEFLKNFE